MSNEQPDKPEFAPFWTVILNEVSFTKGKYTVTANFAYVALQVENGVKQLRMAWLTPETEPFKLELPRWMFPEKRFDKISPYDVYKRFVELFENVPCAVIPEAPVDIPLEKLPPSKRQRAAHAKRKKTEKDIWNPPFVV